MVRLKIGSNDLFYHKLQGENVRSTYTVFTLCVFKYIQPYKNMNIVMCLILTTTLRNSLKYDKFLFFDNNLICFATKISSMPNISNLIYIYIYLIYYIISLSVCKKRVLQKPCQCIQYSLYMYIDFIGKKNVLMLFVCIKLHIRQIAQLQTTFLLRFLFISHLSLSHIKHPHFKYHINV